jgi:putative phosphoribosyl transferase
MDFGVIELNEAAFEALTCEKDMQIVEGATHLFEEPGTLQVVAERARTFFLKHFGT